MITTLYDIRDPDRGGLNQAKLVALRQGEAFGGVPTQSRRQLQILFVRGNHWITVTNVHQGPENLVYVLDSLQPHFDNELANLVSAVFRFNSPRFHLQWLDMSQQPDGASCGVYSIAHVLAVCLGIDLTSNRFLHQVLQELLFVSLINVLHFQRKCGVTF